MDLPDLFQSSSFTMEPDVETKAPELKRVDAPLVITNEVEHEAGPTLASLEKGVRDSSHLTQEQKTRLLVLIQELSGRPDDAYVSLKREAEQPLPSWYSLTELYLADVLGMESEVKEIAEPLRDRWFQSELKVNKVVLCESVQAFGQYVPMETSQIRSRQLMILYVEYMGLEQVQKDPFFSSRCEASFDVIGKDGVAVYRYQAPEPFLYQTRSRRHESYLWMKWRPNLVPGSYTLVVTLRDLNAKISAQWSQELEIY